MKLRVLVRYLEIALFRATVSKMDENLLPRTSSSNVVEVVDEAQMMLNTHRIFCALIYLSWAVSEIFLIATWIAGFTLTGSDIHQSFSWMLAHSSTMQMLFGVFIGVNSFLEGLIIYMVCTDKFSWEYDDILQIEEDRLRRQVNVELQIKGSVLVGLAPVGVIFTAEQRIDNERRIRARQCAHCVYTSLNICYAFFSVVELVGLILVLMFPVTTMSTAHYIAASVAFGSAIIADMFLFIRRTYVKYKIQQFDGNAIIFVANLVYFIAEVVMAICFAVISDGVFEFILSIMLIANRLWQVIDFSSYRKPHFENFIQNSHLS